MLANLAIWSECEETSESVQSSDISYRCIHLLRFRFVVQWLAAPILGSWLYIMILWLFIYYPIQQLLC